MKNKLIFYIYFTFILFLSFAFVSNISYAAYPKLISIISDGFETIKDWIIKISTPAAAVAVRYWCFYEKI